MIEVQIADGKGKDKFAEVSEQGELIIRPAQYSTAKKQQITDANAVNFFKPQSGKKLIISGTVINADKSVTASSLVDIYEAVTDSETTIDTSIFSIDINKNDSLPILPVLIETTEGKFINGKADDFNVNVTVLGYFVDV